MAFTDEIVRSLPAVGRQVAVGEVVADQALVAGGPGAFESREREARKPIHVDLVGLLVKDWSAAYPNKPYNTIPPWNGGIFRSRPDQGYAGRRHKLAVPISGGQGAYLSDP